MGTKCSRRDHLAVLGIALTGCLGGCLGGDGGSEDRTGDDESGNDDSGDGDPGDDESGDGDPGDDQDGTMEAEVIAFELADQSSDGSTVTIDDFHATHASYIVITSMHGETLAESPVLVADEVHEDIRLVLEPPVTMEHTLKAVAYRADDTPYTANGEDVARLADLAVVDEGDGDDIRTPALFSIRDLEPAQVEIAEPGAPVTVTATVVTTGETAATQEVLFSVDGRIQDSRTVSLDGDESVSVSFDMETAGFEPGSSYLFDISSDDSSKAGVVSVESAD